MWPFNLCNRKQKNHDIVKTEPIVDSNVAIEFEPFFPGSDYVVMKYTIDGGQTWAYLHEVRPPRFRDYKYDWEWKMAMFDLDDTCFDTLRNKFSTHEKIKAHQDAERERYERERARRANARSAHEQERKDKLLRINGKL